MKSTTFNFDTLENTFESTKADLELLVLEDTNQSLGVSTFILMVILVENSWELVLVLILKKNNIFTEVLSDTIIWDGGKRERSVCYHVWYHIILYLSLK